jgi:acyl-CoA thioester hydrolase
VDEPERAAWDPVVVELLRPYPVVVTTMVGWGDMDSNRHVNNVIYFRYIEHARIRYFEEIGFVRSDGSEAIGPILASADCRYRKPLEYPDTISIGARINDVEVDQFTINTIIVSHAKKAIVAESQQRSVCFDYQRSKKTPLPEVIRRRIAACEHRAR